MTYTFYCNCFQNNVNKFTQFNQKNLMCGSSYLSDEYKKILNNKNFSFDDSDDNISHLNPWLGDLTGLYWVWKNTDDEIVGTNQYRRKWSNEQIESIKFSEKTLYITAPFKFDESVYQQYSKHHGEIGMLMLYEAAYQKKIPFTFEQLDILKNLNYLSSCNMFFGHRKVFNKVCSVLFEIIFEVYNGTKFALPFIQNMGQKRMIAFLSERILTLLYLNSNQYFGDIDIVDVGWETLYD